MAKLEVAREVRGSVKPGIERFPAHSKAAQIKFDQLIGFTEAEVEVQSGDVTDSIISDNEALLFARAIGHSNYRSSVDPLLVSTLTKEEADIQTDIKHPDPCFTEDTFPQYLEEVCKWNGMMALQFAKKELSDDTLLHWKGAIGATCNCEAHSSSNPILQELIELNAPLTDDIGAIVAKNLLQPILEKIGLNITLEKCLAGTPFNFIFEVKTSAMKKPVILSGWPDHVLLEGQVRGVRRDRLDRLIGVGETQSPPGETKRSLANAVAQAGIYALGQIIRSSCNRLVVVVLSKGKRVALLLMSMRDSKLYYKYPGSSDGFDLTDPRSLQLLAVQLKRSILWQGQSQNAATGGNRQRIVLTMHSIVK